MLSNDPKEMTPVLSTVPLCMQAQQHPGLLHAGFFVVAISKPGPIQLIIAAAALPVAVLMFPAGSLPLVLVVPQPRRVQDNSAPCAHAGGWLRQAACQHKYLHTWS